MIQSKCSKIMSDSRKIRDFRLSQKLRRYELVYFNLYLPQASPEFEQITLRYFLIQAREILLLASEMTVVLNKRINPRSE